MTHRLVPEQESGAIQMFQAGEFQWQYGDGSNQNTSVDTSFSQEVFSPGTKTSSISGKLIEEFSTPELEFFSSEVPQTEKELLLSSADEHITSGGKLKHFKEDLETFEERASRAGLPDSEVTGTFANIRRIMEDKNSSLLDDRDRMILALQVMHNAAKPNFIDQGHHDTCVLSTLEVRAYTRAPSSASKLVADIASENAFYTKDSTKIDLDRDSLKPDEEAKREIPRDGERSFASQIFSISAVNVFWMRVDVDENGNRIPKGSFRFTQLESLRKRQPTFDQGIVYRDFGERVIDMRPDPPQILFDGPVLPSTAFEDIYQQITGTEDSGFVVSAASSPFTEGLVTVESDEELGESIGEIEENGMLPAIVVIHSNNYPWNTYPGSWHAVNITEYMPEDKKVNISDQYGRRTDRKLKLSELYRASTGPSGRR